MRCVLCMIVLVPFAAVCFGGEFHVDPVNGSPDGDGSAARPWKDLQAVIDRGLIETRHWDASPHTPGSKLVAKNAGAPIKGGDTILLHNGYHGELSITGCYNAEPITIEPVEGHEPRFRAVRLRSSSHWVLRGLHVSGVFGPGKKPRTLIELSSHGWTGPIHDVTVEDCVVQSAADVSKWTKQDWNDKPSNGISADGTRMTVRGNRVTNVNFGISVGATHAVIERNAVVNFAGDGLRGLGDHSVFAYNVVKNCYDVNDNHDDGFQSWSLGPDRRPGTGKVVGLVLRGNTIINYEDPDQPFRGTLQGIGCFDGMFEDWVIENNVVIVDHWHGITLLGARNCRIVNNTVIDRNPDRPGPPWIMIDKHKKGERSIGCVIRNNLAVVKAPADQDVTADHNLAVTDPQAMFVDPERFDLRLKPTSPAVDAGSADLAPSDDRAGDGRPQGKAVDLGAYELQPPTTESPATDEQ